MYCRKCGQQMPDEEARFCTNCGHSSGNGPENAVPPVRTDIRLNNTASGKDNKAVIITIVSVLCVILLLVFVTRDKASTSSNSSLLSSFTSAVSSTTTLSSPEDVTMAFMQAAYRKDLEDLTPLCYRKDQAELLGGLAIGALTDLSSDMKIRHKPTSCKLVKKTSTRAEVEVYDQNHKVFCLVKLDKIDGNWRVAYL